MGTESKTAPPINSVALNLDAQLRASVAEVHRLKSVIGQVGNLLAGGHASEALGAILKELGT